MAVAPQVHASILSDMTAAQIASLLQDRFGEKILAAFPDDKHPRIHVDAPNWRPVAEFLLREPSLKLDWLQNLSGVDYVADDKMCVVYDLWTIPRTTFSTSRTARATQTTAGAATR